MFTRGEEIHSIQQPGRFRWLCLPQSTADYSGWLRNPAPVHTMWGPGSIAKVVCNSNNSMVYGTQIRKLLLGFIDQQTYLSGPHIVHVFFLGHTPNTDSAP